MSRQLYDLIVDGEDWLTDRVLRYATAQSQAPFASMPPESWRASVAGLSEVVLAFLQSESLPGEGEPSDDPGKDPIASYGVIEARKYRRRGATLEMFLSLVECYRRSYLDLVRESSAEALEPEDRRRGRQFVNRFFDRLELGFCTEWASASSERLVAEMQTATRALDREAQRHRSIFALLSSPVLLLDSQNHIDAMNPAAEDLLRSLTGAVASRYRHAPLAEALPWMAAEVQAFAARSSGPAPDGPDEALTFVRWLELPERKVCLRVRLAGIEGGTGVPDGTAVFLEDITSAELAAGEARYERQLCDAVAENMPIGLAVLDRDLILRRCNRAYSHMVGKYMLGAPEPLVGTSCLSSMPGGEEMESWLRRARDTGQIEAHSDFLTHLHQEGRERAIAADIVVVPLADAGGRIERILVLIHDLTDWYRLQNEARQREEQFRTLIEGLDDAVFSKDTEGRFIDVNSEMARRLSRRKEDILGKTALDIYPTDTAHRELDENVRVLRHGMTVESEEFYLTPLGAVARQSRKIPLRDADGTIVGLIGISRDTTERTRAEEALQRREEHFRFLTDNISDIIGILGQDGTLRYVSSSVERVLGYHPEEVLGRPLLDLMHPENRAAMRDACTSVLLQAGSSASCTGRARHSDGSYRFIEAVVINHLTNSAVAGIVVTLRDTTEHQRAEEALAKGRDFYLALLDEFPSPVWRSGQDGRHDYVNKSWLSFTGRAAGEELGDAWLEGVHPEDRDSRASLYWDAFGARKPYEAEYRLRRYDGEYRWMIDFGRPYYDVDGAFAGYIGSMYDITERKAQEQQLGYLATHDPLTGLPNRRLLEEALTRSVARSRRGRKSALLFLDLDEFKYVNDTFGHAAGDQVLNTVTRILQEHLRTEDLLARFAGDEFAVLLEDTGMDEARAIAERNRRKVEEFVFSVGDKEFRLSVSIGVVEIDGQESVGYLMSHADNAMYNAKEQGRNRVVLYRADRDPGPAGQE